MRRFFRFPRLIPATVMLVLLATAPARALLIVPTFDATITSDPNVVTIENAITLAANTIGGLYSDPGTVKIYFQTSGAVFGQSNTGLYSLSYADYVAALQADAAANPTNTTLNTAVTHLASGNDANGARPIAATSALFRVGLGFSGATPCFNAVGTFTSGCNAVYDGVVTINNALNYAGQGGGVNSQAVTVIEHEIDEVLGGGGPGSTLNDVLAGNIIGTFTGPMDLYRYASSSSTCAGITTTPSFSTLSSTVACYSVDGGQTSIVQMNQNSGGDFGDFTGGINIQNAFAGGTVPSYTTASPEYQMLLSIGYDPVSALIAAPEPASAALLGGAMAGLGLARRKGRRTQ